MATATASRPTKALRARRRAEPGATAPPLPPLVPEPGRDVPLGPALIVFYDECERLVQLALARRAAQSEPQGAATESEEK